MIALDSNVLVYAQQRDDRDGRHLVAMDIVARTAHGGAIVPLQVLGEFLNVCRVKLKIAPQDAIDQTRDYLDFYDCPETGADDLIAAADLANRHRLQFFDALILTVAARAGATVFLSEDMQDGWTIGDLTVLDPFNPANRAALDAAIESSG